MKEQVAKTWVEALRSGDYKQTTGVLYDGKGYCCLGVLCCLMGYKFEKAEGSWSVVGSRKTKDDACKLVPPWEIVEKVGMASNNGQIYFDTDEYVVLAGMNDEGQSFETIADFIEENWQVL